MNPRVPAVDYIRYGYRFNVNLPIHRYPADRATDKGAWVPIMTDSFWYNPRIDYVSNGPNGLIRPKCWVIV